MALNPMISATVRFWHWDPLAQCILCSAISPRLHHFDKRTHPSGRRCSAGENRRATGSRSSTDTIDNSPDEFPGPNFHSRKAILGRPRNGCDLFSVVHQREAQTRVHPPAIHMDRASPTLAMIAAFLRAGEGNDLANTIQQSRARIDSQLVVFAVNPQCDWYSSLNTRRVRSLRPRFVMTGCSTSANNGRCGTTSHR